MMAAEHSFDLPIGGLCDHGCWSGSSWRRTLYLPVGVVVALFRLLATAVFGLLSSLLPSGARHRTFRLFQIVLGMRLRFNLTRDQISDYTDGCVVACNHVSVLDSLVVMGMPNTVVMMGRMDFTKSILVYLAFRCSGASYWRADNRRQLVQHFLRWKESPHGATLYTTPEDTIGNGRGLFRFKPETLNRGFPVVPAALTIRTPFGLHPHPLFEPPFLLYFRLLMMPWTEFELNYLEKQTSVPGQHPQNFADQVQRIIADHLGIPATRHTREDKHRYRANAQPTPTRHVQQQRFHVIFDFDRTIIPDESFLELLKWALRDQGRHNDIACVLPALQRRIGAGRLGLGDYVAGMKLISRIRRHHVDQYNQHCMDRMDPAITAVFQQLRDIGGEPHILSHGYIECVKPVARRLGIRESNIRATKHFHWLLGRVMPFGLTHVFGRQRKSEIINRWRQQRKIDGLAIMVGDSGTDFEAYQAGAVDGFVSADYFVSELQTLTPGAIRRAHDPADLLGHIVGLVDALRPSGPSRG